MLSRLSSRTQLRHPAHDEGGQGVRNIEHFRTAIFLGLGAEFLDLDLPGATRQKSGRA